jgi:hypothetical protein
MKAMSEMPSELKTGQIVEINPPTPAGNRDDSQFAMLMDSSKFEQLQRVGDMIAASSLMPEHLRGNPADCCLVANQAMLWGFNPFAVAQCTYIVGGKLGYEGKLIAAVVNQNAKLEKSLSYSLTGIGENMTCTVSGTLRGESTPRTVTATWKEGSLQSKGRAKWDSIPDQQLCYYAARKWARRHTPEVMLGIYSEDEISNNQTHQSEPRTRVIQNESKILPPNPGNQQDTAGTKTEMQVVSPIQTAVTGIEERKNSKKQVFYLIKTTAGNFSTYRTEERDIALRARESAKDVRIEFSVKAGWNNIQAISIVGDQAQEPTQDPAQPQAKAPAQHSPAGPTPRNIPVSHPDAAPPADWNPGSPKTLL